MSSHLQVLTSRRTRDLASRGRVGPPPFPGPRLGPVLHPGPIADPSVQAHVTGWVDDPSQGPGSERSISACDHVS